MQRNQKGFSVVEVLLVLIVVGLIGGIGWYVYSKQQAKEVPKQVTITNFEECKATGNPVMESYPEQCSANGQTFSNSQASNIFTDGLVTFRNANHFSSELRSEIRSKITDPIVYFETKVHKASGFKGVIIDLGLEDDNKTRSDKHGYMLEYVYEDPDVTGIGFVFGEEGKISYWTPQLCDDGGCSPYPDDFKKKYPQNFEAYKKTYNNDPYYIR